MENSAPLDKAKVLKLAQMYFREGQWDKSLIEHGKILALDRNDPDSLASVGDIYFKKKSIQLAFEFYFKAAPYFLALNRAESALQMYQKITRLDLEKLSSDVRMNMNIFKSYIEIEELLKDKRYEIAIAPMGKLLKLRPQDMMALALLKMLISQIDQITPSVQRYQTLGDTFLRNGLLDKAWDMYKKAAEMDPQKLSTLPDLAQTFRLQGHDNEAKKSYLYLAEQALLQEDLPQAEEFAKKAIELKSLEAGYILGLVHFKKKKWMEAKNELEKLLRIKINHLGALIHLAKTFSLLDQGEKATETFQKAFKIDEHNSLLQEAWVDFCLQGPDKEAAIPYLTVLLDKAVSDHHVEKTVQFSKMMIQIRPDLVSARGKLIQALQTLGNFQEAADACRALALIYEQQGLLTESSEWLEKANHMLPVDTTTLGRTLQNPLATPMVSTFQIPEIPTETNSIVQSVQKLSIHSEEILPPHADLPPSSWISSIPEIPLDPNEPPVASANSSDSKSAFSSTPPPPEPLPLNGVQAQLATAQLCIEQGLWKAAIKIYQQILETRPDLKDVRKKLNLVNATYLKQWVQSQNKDR